MIVLETPRLELRELELSDAPFILRLLNEPSFLEFIGDRQVRNLNDAERYIREGPMASVAAHGHGLLHVHLRNQNIPIGICGLVHREYLPDPDIGFALVPEYWGQGYTKEAANAAMVHGREILGIKNILAITSPSNLRSIRVLEKLGLHFKDERSLSLGSSPIRVFSQDIA